MKIRCGRCNNEFEGAVCPYCGQPVATSRAGYTDAVPPAPARPKKRGWVGFVLVLVFIALLIIAGVLRGVL